METEELPEVTALLVGAWVWAEFSLPLAPVPALSVTPALLFAVVPLAAPPDGLSVTCVASMVLLVSSVTAVCVVELPVVAERNM